MRRFYNLNQRRIDQSSHKTDGTSLSRHSPLSIDQLHQGNPQSHQYTVEPYNNAAQWLNENSRVFGTRGYQPNNPHQQESTGYEHHDTTESHLDNSTGLPEPLKTSIEQLSGLSMDKVRVFWNSPKPAQIGELAYTEGTKEEINIYLGPGQKHCLPHEAWHAVQQMRGPVRATRQLGKMKINDDSDLENEATQMGTKALNYSIKGMPMRPRDNRVSHLQTARFEVSPENVVQMYQVKRESRRDSFANPNSLHARALDTVTDSLPRNANAILARYDSIPKVDLVFRESRRQHGWSTGNTYIEAKVGGVWKTLSKICKLENTRGLQLHRDTPIRISVVVYTARHGVPPNNHQLTATLTHEITVHVIHALLWVQKLRSGAYTNRQIRAAWRTSNKPGGLLNPPDEHATFARGDNRSYNQTAQNVNENLPANERPLYQVDIHQDMDSVALDNSIPRYPI